MKRPVPRIILLAATAAIAALAACSDRAAAVAMAPQASDTSAPAILLASGPDTPMDSIRATDAHDDPAELAARMRDAQLPAASTSERVARAR